MYKYECPSCKNGETDCQLCKGENVLDWKYHLFRSNDNNYIGESFVGEEQAYSRKRDFENRHGRGSFYLLIAQEK